MKKSLYVLGILIITLFGCSDKNNPPIYKPYIGNFIFKGSPSGTFTVTGFDLQVISKVILNDIELEITAISDKEFEVKIPESAGSGKLTFIFEQIGDGIKDIERYLKVVDNSFYTIDMSGLSFGKIDFKNKNTGYIYRYSFATGLPQTILKTTDGGKNWDIIIEDVPMERDDFFTSFGPDNIWVHMNHNAETFRKTTDGGNTWTHIYAISGGYDMGKVFHLNEETVVFTASDFDYKDGYIFTTHDGGNNWEQSFITPNSNLHYTELCYKNGNIIFLVDAENDILLKTRDGGITWSESSVGVPLNPLMKKPIVFIDENIGWAYNQTFTSFGGHGLYKTIDGGETWSMEIKDEEFLAYTKITNSKFFTKEKGVFILEKGGYLLTEDGGENWKLFYLDLEDSELERVTFEDFDNESAYFKNGRSVIRKKF